MKKGILFSLVIVLLLFSCRGRTDVNSHGMQGKMVDSIDRAFSKMSEEKGMKAAFLAYMDSNAVLLRPGHNPIVGQDAQKYLQQSNDSSFTLTWEPSDCEVASSDDLAYTYGIYTYKDKDTGFRGTYVSIWKKQEDGNWKFVLDTGNPGVDKKK
jgi:ketosteroid isomerase-like protein